MRRTISTLSVALLLQTLAPATSYADGEPPAASEKLADAAAQFGLAHYAESLTLLQQAESLTQDPELLAKIQRQRGFVHEATGDRAGAIADFMRALRFDPSVRVRAGDHRPIVVELFECARSLSAAGLAEDSVKSRYASEL